MVCLGGCHAITDNQATVIASAKYYAYLLIETNLKYRHGSHADKLLSQFTHMTLIRSRELNCQTPLPLAGNDQK